VSPTGLNLETARVVVTRNSDAAGQRSERSSGYIRIARLSRQSDRPTGQLGETLPFTERLSRSKESHLQAPRARVFSPRPEGLAFDASGDLYVSSYSMNFIEKFSPSGTDLGTFASIGSGSAYGLAFDNVGNLYAANYGGGNIHKFSSSGVDLGIFASTGLVLPRDLVVVPGPVT